MQIKAPKGRPSMYSNKITEEILLRLSEGESLDKICKDAHMPHRATVYKWILKNTKFAEEYHNVKKLLADRYFDEIIDIADENDSGKENVSRSKLRIDTRKWVVAKLAPEKYGDKSLRTNTLENHELQIEFVSKKE